MGGDYQLENTGLSLTPDPVPHVNTVNYNDQQYYDNTHYTNYNTMVNSIQTMNSNVMGLLQPNRTHQPRERPASAEYNQFPQPMQQPPQRPASMVHDGRFNQMDEYQVKTQMSPPHNVKMPKIYHGVSEYTMDLHHTLPEQNNQIEQAGIVLSFISLIVDYKSN